MTCFVLDERARLSIELALTTGTHDPLQHELQDAEGRRLGMTGAEIDTARRGASFDVRTSAAIALALASNAGDETGRHRQRARAITIGISDALCGDIEAIAGHYRSQASETAPDRV